MKSHKDRIERGEQDKFNKLSKEYNQYIQDLKVKWFARQPRFYNVIEVMSPLERQAVNARIEEWRQYITPLAEDWWKKRGYKINWPDDDSKPYSFIKMEKS